MLPQRCEFSTPRSKRFNQPQIKRFFNEVSSLCICCIFIAPTWLCKAFPVCAVLSSVTNFNVGGNKFTIHNEDVRKHPSSLLLQLVDAASIEADVKNEIEIERSGALFKYVNAFLVNGQLPRNGDGYITLDKKTLAELQTEADFYGLQALSDDCKIHQKKLPDLGSYMTIRKYLKDYRRSGIELQRNSMLGRVVRSFRSPFCVRGSLNENHERCRRPIFKSTTASSVNVEELVAFATQSPFGRGTETVVDTSVRNSFEIDGSQLNTDVLTCISERCDLKNLAPHLDLTIRPYKLVVYKEGGHFDAHRDTVRGDGHIGTLVVILNSEYTGGELKVTHGGRTKVVTGPYSWVAMYGDCLHKINAVTSGTRASLIYDIYGTPRTDNLWDNHQDSAVRSFWSEHYRTKWFSNGYGGKKFGFKRLAEAEKDRILDCLDAELANSGPDGVIIALQKLYPDYQNVDPSALQDADRALYDLLTNATTDRNDNHNCDCDTIRHSSNYDVQIVTVVIYRCQQEFDRDGENSTRCMLFSTAAVERELGTGTGTAYDSDTEVEMDITSDEGEEKEGDDSRNIDGQKLEGEGKEEEEEEEEKEEEGNPVVLLPYPLDVTGLLEYTQENWKVGIPEQFVFMVTCLHVRKATK